MVNAYKKFIVVKCPSCGKPSIHPLLYRKRFSGVRRIKFYRCPWCGYHGRVRKEWQERDFVSARMLYARIMRTNSRNDFVSADTLLPSESPFTVAKTVKETVKTERHERQPAYKPVRVKFTHPVYVNPGVEGISMDSVNVIDGKAEKRSPVRFRGFERVERRSPLRFAGREKPERWFSVKEGKKPDPAMRVVGRESVANPVRVVGFERGGLETRPDRHDIIINVRGYMVKKMVARFALIVGSPVAHHVLHGGRLSNKALKRLGVNYQWLKREHRSSREMQKMMGDILAYRGPPLRVRVVFHDSMKYMSERTAMKFAKTLAILTGKFRIYIVPSPFTSRIIARVLMLLKTRKKAVTAQNNISPLHGLYLFAIHGIKTTKPSKRVYIAKGPPKIKK